MKKLISMALTLLILVPMIVMASGAKESATMVSDKPVLVIWDQFFPESQDKLMNSFIEEFESIHDVEVQRTVYDTDSLRTTLRTSLTTENGPDIFYYDAGPAYLGAFASAGMVRDLTNDYEEKGWNDRLADWTVGRVTYDSKKYGVPHEIEYTCVYLNRAILAKLGMSDILVEAEGFEDVYTLQSFEDYETLLKESKNAGYIPIALGNRDPGRGGHVSSYLIALTAGRENVDKILFGNDSWENQKIVESLEMFSEWNDKGYFIPSTNSVSYDEANALFFNETIATNPTGTWLIADILDQVDNAEEDYVICMLPSVNGDLPLAGGSGIGSAFAVSAKSEVQDLAVDFLDFITNKQNSEKWITQGQVIPANIEIDTFDMDLPFMMKQAIEGAALNHSYNLDVVMPSEFNDVWLSGLSAIINGTKTPEQVAGEMQKAWEAAKNSGDNWK